MAFQKGHKLAKGRPKGSRNKNTVLAKDAIQDAFEKLGGVPELIEWAKANLTDFYKLYARLIPLDVNNSHSGGVSLTVLTGVPRSGKD